MKKLFVLSVSALLAGAMIVSCSKKQEEAPAADSDSVAVVEVADSAVVDTVAVDSVVVEEPKAEAAKPAAKKAAAKKEESGDDLESKSAKELFDMCKEAGLKVKPKQDKSVYIEALKAANKDEDDNDDWGDEEEEEAPAKKTPAKKAPAKKAAAKKEEEDDDDWEV